VALKGDLSSHVDGVVYSPALDVAVPFQIQHDAYYGPTFMLKPGEWVIVSRIAPESSEPRDKLYREARQIVGRYAGTFITIPDHSHAIRYTLEVNDRRYMP
jgi:hypothetical protein